MRKNFFLIIFSSLFIPLSALAQTAIHGTVIDKDTNQPVSDVIVQYGATSRDYVYTDTNGKFSIRGNSEDIIYFQCIGFKTKSVLKTVLQQQPTVALELNPVSLNPVVISPYDADMLLSEVMLNTKEKLVTDQPIGYLLHFLQMKSTDSLQNEIYLKYTTTLSQKQLKKDLKKERVPYIYNIIDIRRLQKTVTPTSELYGAEYHASYLFTFGKSENNETTRSYSSDSSLIILQIEPLKDKDGWASGEVRINKDDMTISSIEIESVDSILDLQTYKKYMGKKVKALRKVGRFQFAKSNGKYYMKECYTYYKFRAIDEFDREEDITYYCDVNCIGTVDPKTIKKRQLSGFCQELFYFPDSTLSEFWNADSSSNTDWQNYKYTGELNLGDNTPRSNGVGYYLKKSMFAIPLFLLLLLI
ncbi:carboxypeptidase-like regulatory domain-containing protein [Dysgonomonas sp. Marseille-P4677]|uniref:carboxypeptidase-like regulatory domain-containing protein n=1 Tax=Dysgonomonas sp. Marseille-P4677 TaxID=2364790 RepID=UPI00191195DB|nr:carboxypeptidase-like regulatory domain-containing protein [Dysgonomonas sp. Marseille-P4677]MBK5721178.1 carboxypeptidase-like regulatory domain-containing protein [Dysgonomonas sp. Marseille-P4677]